jgi:hypothetical protein
MNDVIVSLDKSAKASGVKALDHVSLNYVGEVMALLERMVPGSQLMKILAVLYTKVSAAEDIG